MKASSLQKKEKSIELIYKQIKEADARDECKTFIPHWARVSDQTKLELINNGYKVYNGDWDGLMKNSLIIEW